MFKRWSLVFGTGTMTVGTGILFTYNFGLTEVSEDEVIWSWLNAEATDPNHQFYESYQKCIREVGYVELKNPSFENESENGKRREVFKVRGDYLLWKPIHKNTKWFKCTMLLNGKNIHAPYPVSRENDRNLDLNGTILWGHSLAGPFIVLEGNHRFSQRRWWFPYVATVYVGISDVPYEVHAKCGCKKCVDHMSHMMAIEKSE
jgi:hypothetical protein